MLPQPEAVNDRHNRQRDEKALANHDARLADGVHVQEMTQP